MAAGDEGRGQPHPPERRSRLDAYRQFVEANSGDPWKVGSAYLNARTIAKEYGDRGLARKLGEIFGDPNP